ncbi:hypothetical protein M426DRAFT_173071 [Hypoxylon sp. CI-4A]|nr:hypothetical protein M426DRAFT_173071 [Hypoxylon sp. CI-4A]
MGTTKEREWMTGPTFSIDDTVDPAHSSDNSSVTTTVSKRKRASKPKVRTGCITCKIRRVKCDETKPSCTRCLTTGRKCDGYEGTLPPRQKRKTPTPTTSPNLSAYPVPSTFSSSSSTHGGGNSSSTQRTLRPLAADIEGTEQERLFFHRFRQAAEAGLATHASGLEPSFWRRLVPQVGNSSDAAVRHALIALGAAHESMELRQRQQQQQQQQQKQHEDKEREEKRKHKHKAQVGETTEFENSRQQYTMSTEDDSSTAQQVDQLELFMIQQYNLSIYHLQPHIQPGAPRASVETTLVCCLVFVCIETSRGDEGAALAHVANGLQIIRALSPDQPEYGGSSSSGSWEAEDSNPGSCSGGSSSSSGGATLRISRSDWRQLRDFFLALEPTAATYGFSSSQPPTPPCPVVSTWENPLVGYTYDGSVLSSQWESEETGGGGDRYDMNLRQ